MKILFKVIVLVSVLVCCFILWKLYDNFNINKGQFALAYGLLILVGSLFVGWLTDYNFKNQSLYDNREADPLSDWVKIQDRAKGKGDFWKGLVSDSNMDERLQWELENQYDSKGLKYEPPYIPCRPTANYYDRNELKSVGQIIKEYKLDQPKNTFREIAETMDVELRKPYNQVSGRINRNIPAWLFDEAGDAVNPLDHEQSK